MVRFNSVNLKYEGKRMKRYIFLRDDDTNYYTTIDELKNAYEDLWSFAPVTLATIPFVHGSERKILDFDTDPDKFKKLRNWELNAQADELSEYHKVHPIGDNKELVCALKQLVINNKIEIAQHGVEHRYTETGAEMLWGKTDFERIRAGKEYLERVFNNQIYTFIPPSNSIDAEAAYSIKKAGMNIVCSSSFKYKNKVQQYMSYINNPAYCYEKIIRKIRKSKPPIHKRNNIFIVMSHTLGITDNNSDVKNKINILNYELEKYGFTALGSHYRLFSNVEYKKKYYEVINYLHGVHGIEFVTANEYYKRIKEEYYE